MGLGKFLVLILQQLGKLGAVCVVLIIGDQAAGGTAQIVAVHHGIFGDGIAVAGFAAPVGIVAAVVIVFPIGVAAQVILIIVIIVYLYHHVIDGGAVNINPADGILILLLHGQRVFQHGLLQLLQLFLLGGLGGVIGVGGVHRPCGVTGVYRVGICRVLAAGGEGKYHT